MAWLDEDLTASVMEEFEAYAEVPPELSDVARWAVKGKITYDVWAARDLDHLPEALRKKLKAKSKPRPRRRASATKAPRKPRVAPALTRYQATYRERLGVEVRAEVRLCSRSRCRRPALEGDVCGWHRRKKGRVRGMREKLEENREGVNHHFTIFANVNGKVEEIKGYIHTGLYEDGRLGELFVKVGKPGDYYAWVDQFATAASIALQYGAPVEDLFRKFVGARFEPSGRTKNPDIPSCTSIVDYVARVLLLKHGNKEALPEADVPAAGTDA